MHTLVPDKHSWDIQNRQNYYTIHFPFIDTSIPPCSHCSHCSLGWAVNIIWRFFSILRVPKFAYDYLDVCINPYFMINFCSSFLGLLPLLKCGTMCKNEVILQNFLFYNNIRYRFSFQQFEFAIVTDNRFSTFLPRFCSKLPAAIKSHTC